MLDYLGKEPAKTADWNVTSPGASFLHYLFGLSPYAQTSGAMYYNKYHEVSKLPQNFVALGDAVMKLNPVFG